MLPRAGWLLSWQPQRPRAQSPPGSQAAEMPHGADLQSLASLSTGWEAGRMARMRPLRMQQAIRPTLTSRQSRCQKEKRQHRRQEGPPGGSARLAHSSTPLLRGR